MNIEIRPAKVDDCPSLARLVIDGNESAFRGLVPDKCLKSLTPEESARNWKRNFTDGTLAEGGELLFVAQRDADVIGLVMAGRDSGRVTRDRSIARAFTHDLSALYVDPALHKRGIGRRLVAHAARSLIERDCVGLLVRVLVDNPNGVFYERLGAERLGTQPYDWEGCATEEVLYVWSDLKRLSEA